MRRSYVIVCALGFAFLLATVTAQAESPTEKSIGKNAQPKRKAEPVKSPVFQTGAQAIEAALQKPISCEFVETPLKDVIDYLKDVARIEIFLDDSGLKEAGIDPAASVTCNLRGLRLEKVLDLVLKSEKLSWTIHDDVLYVATPAKLDSEEFCTSRVYDVADLVVYQDENGKKFDDYAPLTDLITATIDDKSWLDNGGAGTILGETLGTAKVLVVAHHYQVHKKISALLAEIRTIAAKKSGGDGLPTRTRPKPAQTAATGCFRCPGMILDSPSTKDASPQSKPTETPPVRRGNDNLPFSNPPAKK